jgi:hypothetical protein
LGLRCVLNTKGVFRALLGPMLAERTRRLQARVAWLRQRVWRRLSRRNDLHAELLQPLARVRNDHVHSHAVLGA